MIGQSFSLTNPSDQQYRPQGAATGSGASPLQQAIQVLQLRLPHFFGSTAPAAAPLLQSQGAPAGFDINALMQHLFGVQTTPAASPASAPVAQPSGAPSAPMGGQTSAPMTSMAPFVPPAAPLPSPLPPIYSGPLTPVIHYQPNPQPAAPVGPSSDRELAPGPGRFSRF